MRVLLTFLLTLTLLGCADKIEIPGESHEVAFTWNIVTKEEMVAIYMHAGEEVPEGKELEGFVAIDPLTDQYLIYSLRPDRLDDQATCTLGHEVLHIVAGNYHK